MAYQLPPTGTCHASRRKPDSSFYSGVNGCQILGNFITEDLHLSIAANRATSLPARQNMNRPLASPNADYSAYLLPRMDRLSPPSRCHSSRLPDADLLLPARYPGPQGRGTSQRCQRSHASLGSERFLPPLHRLAVPMITSTPNGVFTADKRHGAVHNQRLPTSRRRIAGHQFPATGRPSADFLANPPEAIPISRQELAHPRNRPNIEALHSLFLD